MKKIGITGGIGAGKSVISKYFENLGFPVYYSDKKAKKLITNDIEIVNSMKMLFGSKTYTKDGEYNSRFIAQQVFEKPEKLEKLNAIVHPKVKADFDQFVRQNQQSQALFKESALLSRDSFELDCILTVDCPDELRIQRIMERDPHRKKSQIYDIFKVQPSREKYLGVADFVILNDEKHSVLKQLQELKIQLDLESCLKNLYRHCSIAN